MGLLLIFAHPANLRIRHSPKYITTAKGGGFLRQTKIKGQKKLIVTKTLKEIEELLEEHSFVRVHRCYFANINEVRKYVKGEGGYLVMSDGTSIDVARNKNPKRNLKIEH